MRQIPSTDSAHTVAAARNGVESFISLRFVFDLGEMVSIVVSCVLRYELKTPLFH